MASNMEIFTDAYTHLSAFLQQHGFSFNRTRRISHRDGDLFRHSITFATLRSANSVQGTVMFEVRALASSEKLAEYRSANGIKLPINNAYLFGTTIENIYKPAPPYIRYNIGEEVTREKILLKIENILIEEVINFFSMIETPEKLVSAYKKAPIPCLEKFDAITHYVGLMKASGRL